MKIENSDNFFFFSPNYFLFYMSFNGVKNKLCKKVTLSKYVIIYECTDGRTHYYYGYIYITQAYTQILVLL